MFIVGNSQSISIKYKLKVLSCFSVILCNCFDPNVDSIVEYSGKIQHIQKYLIILSESGGCSGRKFFFLISFFTLSRIPPVLMDWYISTMWPHPVFTFLWKRIKAAFPGPPPAQLKSFLMSGQSESILMKYPRVATVEVFPYYGQWSWWISGWELSVKPFWWMEL